MTCTPNQIIMYVLYWLDIIKNKQNETTASTTVVLFYLTSDITNNVN